MKKFITLLIGIIFIISLFNFSLANEEDANAIYTDNSGENIQSGENELDENAILIDNNEDYENLLNNTETSNNQAELKDTFENQQKDLTKYESGESEQKFVITKVLSDIKEQYTSDYYYTYIIKYQTVNIRTSEGKETPAVVILSYDVSNNKSIHSLKAGDTVYGYIEYVSSEDSTYHMVPHGLTDDEIAYVSISNQDRTLGIVLLISFTILLLILYAGKKGAKLLIPLFVIVDLFFIVLVPEIEVGKNIILLASLIALELIILITILKNGWSKKTMVALLSSLIVVALVTSLGILFGNANSLTGKGIISEENYDLLSNVYYIDTVFKSKIGTYDIYIAMIILITSVVSAVIASRITDLSEKYAGSEGMINNIIEEAKSIVADYPMILAIIFLTLFLPNYMITAYNHPVFENLINSEAVIIPITIGLLSIISSLIIAPITAIVSYLFMGKVEIKQISE